MTQSRDLISNDICNLLNQDLVAYHESCCGLCIEFCYFLISLDDYCDLDSGRLMILLIVRVVY